MDILFNIASRIDIFLLSILFISITFGYTYKYLVASKLPIKYLTRATIMALVQAVVELTNIVLLELKIPDTVIILKFTYSIQFIICMLLSVSAILFVYDYILILENNKKQDGYSKTVVIPIVIDIIILTFNFFTGIMFEITDDCNLIRGNLYFIHYAIIYTYSIVTIGILIAKTKKIPSSRALTLIVILSFCLIACAVELIFNIDTAISPTNCFTISLMLVFLRTQHTSLNPITRLINKTTLLSLLKEKEAKGINFSLVLLDLDNLYQINTEYGFQEGNHALRMFAQEIKNNIKEPNFVTSCSADEFIIYFENCNKSEINETMLKLSTITRSLTLGSNKSYTISFTHIDEEFDTANYLSSLEMIQHMYSELYKLKNKSL